MLLNILIRLNSSTIIFILPCGNEFGSFGMKWWLEGCFRTHPHFVHWNKSSHYAKLSPSASPAYNEGLVYVYACIHLCVLSDIIKNTSEWILSLY